jgi:predicted O-linked N-acetylglucosamine transferase (SPINDLY family)
LLDPESEGDAHYTERLVRLRHFSCYRPPDEEVAIAPPPIEFKGVVTFGAFQPLFKVSTTTVRLWSDLLKACAGSRLCLMTRGGNQRLVREMVQGWFAKYGIDPARIEIRGSRPFSAYLAAHNDVDLFVDTLPWNGHTTTLHALWMGVPTLTLYGERRAGRMGAAVQLPLGLDDFVAFSPADFVAKGCAAAASPQRLSRLRQNLRSQLLASPLCDGQRFSRDFEAAVRSEWHRWCDAANGF